MALLHASIAVDDIEAAQTFLCAMFGLTPLLDRIDITDAFTRMTGHAVDRCLLSQLAGPEIPVALELIEAGRLPRASFPHAHFSFSVPQLDDAMARAFRLGARARGVITQFDEGRSVYLSIPGGMTIELEELV
ncbi:VOC family protein [Gluconacetobacter sacchari]|uniref:VOC family protein n=1 Tax=Gluconacetobacter sacchari TaxID=92759 RepID=A0A7W4NT04_9PROT|nr:VOC family protein [Gluconacetobacter sacchari]MBB2161775.1 VOC family protein [Gluconacetobacter sacchari]